MALSAKEMGEAIIRNLPEKTGKTVEEWIASIPRDLGTDKKRIITWLKESAGLGHHQAVTVWERFANRDEYGDLKAIERRLFGAEDTALYARYRELREHILGLGEDVVSIACRTYIPFKRRRQFAVLAPHKSNLRIGVASAGVDPPEEFLPAKGLGGSDRITHYADLPLRGDLPQYVPAAVRLAYGRNG
ncbi:MAG: DUF4287 domain-containing protein [Spirochaetales bacterium]|nr:DUF4287 domain-containing protein [Spirochaetales bacterium]